MCYISRSVRIARQRLGQFFKGDETEHQFIDKYIKTSSEFDKYLFDHRDEILAKQSAEFNAKMKHGKAVLEERVRVAKCPSCGSNNVSKINVFARTLLLSYSDSQGAQLSRHMNVKIVGLSGMWVSFIAKTL